MTWEKQNIADIPTQLWSNGKGYTRIISEGNEKTGSKWRLSIAEITKDSSFSKFSGWERFFILFGQKNLTIFERNGAWKQVVKGSSAPYQFSGDEEVMCSGKNYPVQALNLMTKNIDIKNISILIINKNFHSSDKEKYIFLIPSSGKWMLHTQDAIFILTPGEVWNNTPPSSTNIKIENIQNNSLLFYIEIDSES